MRLRWATAMLILGLLVVACTELPAPTLAPPPTATPPALTYENPVFPRDFPDPFVLQVDDAYYAYATNARHMNVQVIRSEDLMNWTRVGLDGDALPELPEWAASNQFLTWAPSVLQREDDFVLYYVARYVESGRQCISYAVSDSPDGPFIDPNDGDSNGGPFICQLDQGGSIDPEPFMDRDGTLYLLWKNDGNCCNLPVWLYSQELTPDGRSLVGDPHRLVQMDQEWEQPLIENPTMVYHGGRYHLLYSANWWESPDYAVGYAGCQSPRGPCEKPQAGPILASAGRHVGPGGASFFSDLDGNPWVAYHAWIVPNVGYPVGSRQLHLGRVTFQDGMPVIHRPENGGR